MFKEIINSFGSNIITSIGDTVAKFVTTDKDKKELEYKLNELTLDFKIKLIKADLEIEAENTKRVNNAIEMQKTALNQGDLFSKRFLYYFTFAIFGFVGLFDLCLIFVNIPPSNKEIVNVLCGALNSSVLVAVINFFFGSSISSKEKDKTINNLSK